MDIVINYYGNVIVNVHGIRTNEVSTVVMRHNAFPECINSFEFEVSTDFMFVRLMFKQELDNE